METIKVNMSPNPLDVQTIHASQNDGEARQWEFELHNNGEKIESSSITDQLVFKAYEGGTEEILPTNGSVPTTAPFLGDIRYPQGLLTDQEFTYRQSPTESDGLAKITDVKGNTIVWNQLIEKGNMTDGWTFSNSTGSYSNNILTFTASAQGGFVRPNLPQSIISGHKYLGTVDVKGTSAFSSNILFVGRSEGELNSASVSTSWQTFAKVFTNTVTENNYFPRVSDRRSSGWDAVQVRNCMLIDLTQMGLDSITSVDEFTSLFPLPYYSYNQGSLLSFNGNGIKTVNEDEREEHNTTLPISTYFPTGMKSAGNVYDELTPTKAITRIGSVDLGTLTFSNNGAITGGVQYITTIPGKAYGQTNIVCSKFTVSTSTNGLWTMRGRDNSGSVALNTSYATAEEMRTAMSGVYLYYELATPTETSFSTASLVTENAEIPLSNEDGTLIGKCTEQLSENPGFIDAKIKLSDADGECYSNKIQLHVERSPQ